LFPAGQLSFGHPGTRHDDEQHAQQSDDTQQLEQAHAPATVMLLIRISPQWMLPRVSRLLPQASMPRNIWARFPAIVTSSTGWLISPFSIRNPVAPRE